VFHGNGFTTKEQIRLNTVIIPSMQTAFTLSAPINLSVKPAKPFMKWAGGKGQLIEKLDNLFPLEMKAGEITKYVEPFIGGGALFFYIAQNYPSIESFFISEYPMSTKN
jgi:hypothetical protein